MTGEHTYDDFQTLIGITPDDLSPEDTEKYISVAIGLLNIFGADLEDLTGNEGSKSINCEGREWAAIAQVTRLVYNDFLENVGGEITTQGFSIKSEDFLTNKDVIEVVRTIALALQDSDPSEWPGIILI